MCLVANVARATNLTSKLTFCYARKKAAPCALIQMTDPKIIAFHLPQFHRIPENDQWWGEGFTEWTNVRKAKPIYPGHYQPRVPADGRYYNLLDPEVQDWQANLARTYGLHGFCYYHYWFKGKQLLERPVEQLLERGQPDFPFCLAWANEPWTRAWDGGERHVLMPQSYGGPEDWRKHITHLMRIFRDPRYIRVHDKPMFLIYRTSTIRDLQAMLEVWRTELHQAGFKGIHLVSMAGGHEPEPRIHLFEAFADFEPMWTIFRKLPGNFRRRERWLTKVAKLRWTLFGRANRTQLSHDYKAIWTAIEQRILPPHHYPGAFVDWDNSPRRTADKALVMRNFDKAVFAKGIKAQVDKARRSSAEFLFINAWNEWAEGTYLEPDEARGLFFLEAIRDALDSATD
jgi:lipopolysaccharide biosynthesis protein